MHHCKETLFVLCFLFGASLALAQGQPAGEAHLANAGLHAKGKPSLMAAMARWCSPQTPQSTSLQDRSLRLPEVEMAYQRERQAERPDRTRMLSLVVERECAAFQEARVSGAPVRPIWLLSQLRVLRPTTAGSNELHWRAVATNLAGPVVDSRITFSKGLHMACFGITDARGQVQCTLVDTHPHGPGSEGTPEEHEGPLVVSLAGTVDRRRVQLPAVVIQNEKKHRGARTH